MLVPSLALALPGPVQGGIDPLCALEEARRIGADVGFRDEFGGSTATGGDTLAVEAFVDPLRTFGSSVFLQLRQRDPGDPAGCGDSLADGSRFPIRP